ncbi:MAG: right-handed parallel beta-helix repeat-containing protein [Deltaproteobacteria bacterium]|nr:right-handed parallel beta-helix repeat-containing protein [Deltaproteobacteria bacterium]
MSALGATLYVDLRHASCSDARAKADVKSGLPLCTVQRAAQLVDPGDLVLVGDGVYEDADNDKSVLRLTRGGSAGAPVTFRALHRHRAQLKGTLPSGSTDFNWCVLLAPRVQWVVIDGFDISGCATGVMINNDNHQVVVSGNRIHEIGRRVTTTQYGQDGVSIGGGSTDVTVDGNVIHTIGRLAGSQYPNNHDHAVYIRGSRILVTNNAFYDLKAGWGVHIYGPDPKRELKIVNNTFAEANPGRDGHIIVTTGTSDLLIQNNIFYQPRGGAVQIDTCSDVSKVSLLNNLTDRNQLTVGASCPFTLSGNLTGKTPLFAGPAQHDYHLTAGSPGLDQGLRQGAPDHDLDGAARPAGTAVDVGAFEFGAPLAGDGRAASDSGRGSDGRLDGAASRDAGPADANANPVDGGVGLDPRAGEGGATPEAGPGGDASVPGAAGCGCEVGWPFDGSYARWLLLASGWLALELRRRRRQKHRSSQNTGIGPSAPA